MFRTHPFPSGGIVEATDPDRDIGAEAGREGVALFEVENRRRGGVLFDGLAFSVERLDGKQIVGRFVRYSRFVAQAAKPDLFDVLRVRPLAVSGLLTCADGVVFGRRAASVTQDAGLWELVPSGGVDPSCRDATGRIDVVGQVLNELREEIGIERGQVGSAVPFAVVENIGDHVIDVAVAIETRLAAGEIRRLFRQGGSGEYADLAIVPLADVPQFVKRFGGELAGISRFLLRERGLS